MRNVATSPWLDLAILPPWLAGTIAMIAFLGFLLLGGMFGNPVVALALLLLARRR